MGASDGRIALYLAEHKPLLARLAAPVAGTMAAAIRDVLARRGAVFFADIAREVGGFPNDVLSAPWQMVWAGEVTNDTLGPFATPGPTDRRSSSPRPTRRAPGARWSIGPPPRPTPARSAPPARSAAARSLAGALARRVDRGARRALLVATLDGVEAARSTLATLFAAAGFTATVHGLLERRSPAREADAAYDGAHADEAVHSSGQR